HGSVGGQQQLIRRIVMNGAVQLPFTVHIQIPGKQQNSTLDILRHLFGQVITQLLLDVADGSVHIHLDQGIFQVVHDAQVLFYVDQVHTKNTSVSISAGASDE